MSLTFPLFTDQITAILWDAVKSSTSYLGKQLGAHLANMHRSRHLLAVLVYSHLSLHDSVIFCGDAAKASAQTTMYHHSLQTCYTYSHMHRQSHTHV